MIICGIGFVVEQARDCQQAIGALPVRGGKKIKRRAADLPTIVGFELRAFGGIDGQ